MCQNAAHDDYDDDNDDYDDNVTMTMTMVMTMMMMMAKKLTAPHVCRMCTVQRKGRLNRDRRKHTSMKSDILIIFIIDDDGDDLSQK